MVGKIDIAQVRIGDKVHYQPAHYGRNEWENGIVKEVPNQESEICKDSLRVVYNCNGEWEHYQDYTSALTHIRDLKVGWRHS